MIFFVLQKWYIVLCVLREKGDNDFDSNEKEKDDIEVLLARKLSRGKGKLKGKLPLICFKCKEVGHIASRCPNTRKSDKSETRDKKC